MSSFESSFPPVHDDYELGNLDAWHHQEQKGLERVFVRTQPFLELPEHNRSFLCGRRGSGKSAIAIMSHQNSSWSACYVLPGERSHYGAYMDLVEDLEGRQSRGLAIDIQRFVKLLWTYCLQLTVLQKVQEFALQHAIEHADIRDFVEARPVARAAIGSSLHTVFADAMKAAVDAGSAAAFHHVHTLLADAQFERAVASIPSVLGKHRILLIFDTIESYKIHNNAMLWGLRGVVASLIGAMTAPWYGAVGIRFFVPAEIYEDIASEIPAKIVGSTVFLRWTTGDLIRLVSRRWVDMLARTRLMSERSLDELKRRVAAAVANGDGRRLRDELWYKEGFLPSHTINTRNVPEDTFAFIFRHTQRRPREILFVLNQIVQKACVRHELPHISAASVVEGVHDRKTLQFIVAEALSPYEGYVEKIVDRARATFYERSRLFDLFAFRRFAKAFYEVGPVPDIPPERFIEFLLRAGVVGLLKSTDIGENTPYYAAEFEYLMQDHLPMTSVRQYCVHPALGDLFEMPPTPLRSVYPVPTEDTWLEEEVKIAR